MALDYTVKYAEKIDERHTAVGVTSALMNGDYEFTGAKTIKVTSVTTVPQADYNRTTGYKALTPIENETQEMTMKIDREFTALLDKMDEEETKIKAGEVLARQLREVTIPEIEKYRLVKMIEAATANSNTVTSSAKLYANILAMQEKMDDEFVPDVGRVLLVTPATLNLLKQEQDFIVASNLAQEMLIKGQVGEIDGVAIVKVPKKWMTGLGSDGTTTYTAKAILLHKSAMVSPIKLAEYKVFDSAENQTHSGTKFLGRIYYDAFVLNNKKAGIVALV